MKLIGARVNILRDLLPSHGIVSDDTQHLEEHLPQLVIVPPGSQHAQGDQLSQSD
jgi:hypothetical protein